MPPVSVSLPVDPTTTLPTDAPAAVVSGPNCAPTVRLTVLSVEGCPLKTVVGVGAGLTQEAVALPQ
jgi:hypothetical protein